MTTDHLDIVPSSARHARERVSLSREQLVKKVNPYLNRMKQARINIGDIESWESGQRGMTWGESYAFTKVTMFPFDSLFESEPPDEPLTDFRAPPGQKPVTLDYNTRRHIHQFNNFYELVMELRARLGESEATTNLPNAAGKSTKIVARELRQALGVSSEVQAAWLDEREAISEWSRRVGEAGVFAFALPFDIDVIRGCARWDDGGPPAVALSTQDITPARIFTLMHEVAHLTHRQTNGYMCDPRKPENQTEARMNSIAAEALAPESVVRDIASKLEFATSLKASPPATKSALKQAFKVSTQMLGIRLEELGIVRSSGHTATGFEKPIFRNTPGAKRTRRSTPELFREYLGRPAVSLLGRALDANLIGESEALDYFPANLKLDDLWTIVT